MENLKLTKKFSKPKKNNSKDAVTAVRNVTDKYFDDLSGNTIRSFEIMAVALQKNLTKVNFNKLMSSL